MPRAALNKQTKIGLGWILDEIDSNKITWHSGATGGYNSYIGFAKEKETGVCILTNHTIPLLGALGLVNPHADAIGQKILKELLRE